MPSKARPPEKAKRLTSSQPHLEPIKEMDEENKEAEFVNKVGTEFYHKAAKIMFQKKLTVSKVLGDRIFDMMINN